MRTGGEAGRLVVLSSRASSSESSSGSMSAGGGARGGLVSGFTRGSMEGFLVGTGCFLVGLVVGPVTVGTINGEGREWGGSTGGVGNGRVGRSRAWPERRIRGVTADRRVRLVGAERIGRGGGLGGRRDGLGSEGLVRLAVCTVISSAAQSGSSTASSQGSGSSSSSKGAKGLLLRVVR